MGTACGRRHVLQVSNLDGVGSRTAVQIPSESFAQVLQSRFSLWSVEVGPTCKFLQSQKAGTLARRSRAPGLWNCHGMFSLSRACWCPQPRRIPNRLWCSRRMRLSQHSISPEGLMCPGRWRRQRMGPLRRTCWCPHDRCLTDS